MPQEEVFTVSATNISQRPTVITNIGFSFGVWRWKRHGIFTFMPTDISHGIPKALSDGERGSWSARLGTEDEWVGNIVEKFNVNRWSVFTWRVHIHTSNGGTTTIRPEKNIRGMLLEVAKMRVRG